MAIKKLAAPSERRKTNENELAFMMAISKLPDAENPGGVSDWEAICEMLDLDSEASPSQVAVALLNEAGLGDLVPEKKNRVRGESDTVVVGIKLPNKEEALKRISALVPDADIDGGAAAFRLVLGQVWAKKQG